MNPRHLPLVLIACTWTIVAATNRIEIFPLPGERQLADRMHSAMEQLPSVAVGHADAEIVGRDNRALQAAVDYVAGLGGGIVRIGPGEYLMRDSLHLRNNVIESNGKSHPVAGIRIRGETRDIILRENVIRDTRPEASRHQTIGIRIDEKAGAVTLERNAIDAETPVVDQRPSSKGNAEPRGG